MGMGPGLCKNTHGLPMSHTKYRVIIKTEIEDTILKPPLMLMHD